MDATLLIGGILAMLVGLATIWIALPSRGTVSRAWLRSQAGVLYPLIPLAFLVFGLFAILRAFNLA
jgi:hypothetical protein